MDYKDENSEMIFEKLHYVSHPLENGQFGISFSQNLYQFFGDDEHSYSKLEKEIHQTLL
jgi:hypothetical protein